MAGVGRSKQRNHHVTLEQILKWPKTQAIFNKLTKAHFPGDLLGDGLVAFANEDQQKPPMVPGTTERTLMRNMFRINEWAEEIARLNQNPHINPAQRISPFLLRRPWKGVPLEVVFAELPELLRMYEAHLWCARVDYRATRIKGRLAMKLSLVTIARHLTRRPRFGDLANLLTAALAAAGEEKDVSAESLLQLEKDHPDEIKCITEELRKLNVLPLVTPQTPG